MIASCLSYLGGFWGESRFKSIDRLFIATTHNCTANRRRSKAQGRKHKTINKFSLLHDFSSCNKVLVCRAHTYLERGKKKYRKHRRWMRIMVCCRGGKHWVEGDKEWEIYTSKRKLIAKSMHRIENIRKVPKCASLVAKYVLMLPFELACIRNIHFRRHTVYTHINECISILYRMKSRVNLVLLRQREREREKSSYIYILC